MRRFFFLIVLVAMLGSSAVAEDDRIWGIGVMLGEPTGLSLRKWLTSSSAIDASAAWSFLDEGAIQVHGDYLFHNYDLTSAWDGSLPLYYGIGARLRFDEGSDEGTTAGVRVPVGVSYLFERSPVDLFGEVVPILDVSREADFELNAVVGLRYYFR